MNASKLKNHLFDDDAQADHVGIVLKNDGKGTLWVYEGNTSGDTKGNRVKKVFIFIKSVLEAWSEARLAYFLRNKKNYPIGS